MGKLAKAKNFMVERHLKGRDISDPMVLAAMQAVNREAFIPENLRNEAYADRPIPIGEGQTISQPYIVALMTQMLDLKGGEKVLEVGTGSGYGAAVLGHIAGQVFTIERHKPLAEKAQAALAAEGVTNVTVVQGDGTQGLESEAPFDAIVVTAAGPKVPEALKQHLKIGGRLVIPVGDRGQFQRLVRVIRTGDDTYSEADMCGVAFVPLIGEEGF